ncbi:MAG: thioredoxin family protein [Bacilli bacterium]|nr:thioredoxin family protein [Bacilli bacterium]
MSKNVVIVSAVWCGSCLILKTHLKKLKEEYQELEIKYLDYDFDEEEVSGLNVSNKLPVIIAYNDSIEISRLIGEKSYEEIVNFLKECSII